MMGTADVSVASSSEVSDEELLRRLAMGNDQEALSDLYDRHQSAMYGLASRITQDPVLAQDAVQEAFVGVWRNASRYAAGRASVRTWMMSIVHHRAVDLIRRRRPTTQLPEHDSPEPALTAPDVWPEVSAALDRDIVQRAVGQLPDAQREVISLAYFDGLTHVEIAERTGVPLGTVKSRVRLGLGQMRRTLEGAT